MLTIDEMQINTKIAAVRGELKKALKQLLECRYSQIWFFQAEYDQLYEEVKRVEVEAFNLKLKNRGN